MGTSRSIQPTTRCRSFVQRYPVTRTPSPRPTAHRPASLSGPSISRRSFLAGAAATLALGGCSSGDGSSADSTTSLTTPAGRFSIIALFDSGRTEAAIGMPHRLPFALGDRSGVLLADPPKEVVFAVTVDGEPAGRPTTVAPRSSGVPRPYFPLMVTPRRPGLHEVTATVGSEEARAAFVIGSAPPLVVPGGPMLPVATPTPTRHRGVEPICTRVPACPFHEVSLDVALEGDRPVALLVASPGHCDSSLCPPAVDLLIDAARRYPSIEFVHGEVYADAERVDSLADASPTDVARTYELRFEPSLMLATADGNLAERLDHIFDATELDEALTRLTRS